MRIAATFLALLVLCSGTIPAVAFADGGTESAPGAATADRPALVGPPLARIAEPEVTELYVAPDPEGNARWTVSVRYNLSTAPDRAAFEAYGREFEAGDADVGLDAAFFRTLADAASRETGREMTIRNESRSATVRNGTGVLNLSFTWTNFVTDTDAGFVIRDAVLMPGNRTWLASIGPSQRLVVETPEGYQVTDTRFGLDNGSVVVEGPHTFREPLSISYQQTAVEEPEPDPGPPWSLIGGALLLGLLVVAVAYVRLRGDGEAPSPPATGPDTGGEPPGAPPPAEEASSEDAGAADDAADEADDAGIDPALLSDEERVEHLLDQNGGRMKQARIVKETGWSDAKVSQLLSTMADEGRVEKLRLGRENLISLPDEEP